MSEYKYLTTCEIGLERDGDYLKRNAIREKWVPVQTGDEDGTCGNVAAHFKFSRKTKKVSVSETWTSSDETSISLYEAIPSALALYRLLCTIDGLKVSTFDDPYKCVWTIGIVHTKTQQAIFFGEHKGGFSFWMPEHSPKDVNPTLLKDLKELLNYLVSDQCAHPYDGLVAGSVA